MDEKPAQARLRETAAYYEQNADAFDARTRNREMADLYAPFLARLPAGGSILDAGCGPGRDARAFADAGYAVTAADASAAMVQLASARLGRPAIHASFTELAFRDAFDGVWACASLLHVPRAELCDALARLRRALKPDGILYASFKYGAGEEFREGRWFNDYDEPSFTALIDRCGGWRLLRTWTSHEERGGRPVQWLNTLSQKTG